MRPKTTNLKRWVIYIYSAALLFFLLTSAQLNAQSIVSGRVTTPDGEGIPGVNVVVTGYDMGTSTNSNGQYTAEIPDYIEEPSLTYSFIGYQSKTVEINNRSVIDVTLTEDVQQLSEVVVVGYGTQERRDLTGSVARVNAEDINRIPTSSVEQALQGQVSGVQITPNSGEPGAAATVRIRGVGTLNNSDPLYVVDGMILDDIRFLNPSDIESIDVLKDASATAIYGSRGANGVVIVTTKAGDFNQETVFNLDAYYGVQEVVDRIDLVNGEQFARLANDLAINEGREAPYPNPEQYGAGTDWQDVIFSTAPIQNYQLSATGGNENVAFALSGNFFSQEGIIAGSDFQRVTLRLNNQYRLTDAVEVGHNLALTFTDQQNAAPGIVTSAYRAYPIFEPYTTEGAFADISPVANPEASAFYNNNPEKQYRTVGNIFADVNVLPNLSFKTSLGIDFSENKITNFTPQFFVSPLQQNEISDLRVANQRVRNWLWENTLTYDMDWRNHGLTVLTGITAQDYLFEDLGGVRNALPGNNQSLWYLNAGDAAEGQTNFNTGRSWSMLSYLFRINYTFLDRYLFTGTFRADGSSRFGEENQYGYFPSLAVGWRISDEPFMRNQNIFSNLKLRASWGLIGNDKIGEYAAIPRVNGNLNAVFGLDPRLYFGATVSDLANQEIQWEESEQYDVGLEIGIAEDKLTFEIDYYYKETQDILVQVPIPDFIGSGTDPVVNAATVANNGFDFSILWRHNIGGLNYSFNMVGSTVNNEVLDLGSQKEDIFGGPVGVGGQLATLTRVGDPIGSFYGYQVLGVFQTEEEINNRPSTGSEERGDLIFADTDNNNTITTQDRTIIGSPIPDFIYGINMGMEFGAFDLNLNFNGELGKEIYNAKRAQRFDTYNFHTDYLDRWTSPGSSNDQPRVTNGGHNYQVSQRFLEDGSYFRLRNVQLGYTLPSGASENLGINNVRIYISGTNVFTITDYSGYTPEIPGDNLLSVGIDQGVYPISSIYSAGINASF